MGTNWRTVKFGDICKINNETYSISENWDFVNYLDTGNITKNVINEFQFISIKNDKLPSRARRKVKNGNIIYSTVRPNQEHYGYITSQPQNFLVSTGFAVIDVNLNLADSKFIYYNLTQREYTNLLQSIAEQSTTTYPSIKSIDIANLKISIPSLSVQKKIAAILSALDDKIELNEKINQNLEAQAQAIFKSWFVDFDPFDGKMPADWKAYKLGEFLPVITGKKNANVSSSKGKYPFFSCAQDTAWTDEFSFDANAILVAGNGDFNVKFYSGKFEAYQRTYVLVPHDPTFTNWLYYVVKYNLEKITSGARGSVIKFITKGNLEDFSFFAPRNLDKFTPIDFFNSANNKIAENKLEILKLSQLRDTLLPKLMSGEIDVLKIEL